jgi:hypothetical protein
VRFVTITRSVGALDPCRPLTFWETDEALEAAQPLLESVKRAETSFREVEATDTARFYGVGSPLNL